MTNTNQHDKDVVSPEIQKLIIDTHLKHGIPIDVIMNVFIDLISLCKPDISIHPDEFTRRNVIVR